MWIDIIKYPLIEFKDKLLTKAGVQLEAWRDYWKVDTKPLLDFWNSVPTIEVPSWLKSANITLSGFMQVLFLLGCLGRCIGASFLWAVYCRAM